MTINAVKCHSSGGTISFKSGSELVTACETDCSTPPIDEFEVCYETDGTTVKDCDLNSCLVEECLNKYLVVSEVTTNSL